MVPEDVVDEELVTTTSFKVALDTCTLCYNPIGDITFLALLLTGKVNLY